MRAPSYPPERPIGAHEGLLGELLRVGRLPGHAQSDAVDEVLVMAQEVGEGCIQVAGQPARTVSAHASRNT